MCAARTSSFFLFWFMVAVRVEQVIPRYQTPYYDLCQSIFPKVELQISHQFARGRF